ncbi:protein PYRICULARIA ORYZAE RESISTANCE 21-like isoform X1 [Triticum dicoccoides]|uniref:protein PYRICULARIA ORYZAE RESISTANCE 21-like isoform X1 n=1 Tax=Triticum dicoccoides TaxID=85692 RepID=UPI00188E7866|nr:protein PYRICULARIA ORYZAE RESISTANCE 21-like isoform X1 [Triticum dicoccoides]
MLLSTQISTIILRVDLDCHQCYKKIRKILCSLQDQERIRTISFDTNNNAVIIDGPFDPHKLSCRIRCKGGKVIKGVQIMGDGKPEEMAGPPPSNSRKKKSKSKGKGKESPPPPAEQPQAYHPQPPTEQQPQAYYPQPPTEQPPAYHQQPPTEQPPEYHPQQHTEQQPAYHPQPPAEQPQEYHHPQQPPPDREMSATMQAVREEERPKERPAELETPKEMQVHFVPEAGPECHKNPRERRHPMGEMPSWNGPPMVEIPSLPARPVGPCRCTCCASCYQGYYGSCRCSDCGRTYGYTAAVALPPPAGCYGGARAPYCGGYSGYRVICEEDQAGACIIM